MSSDQSNPSDKPQPVPRPNTRSRTRAASQVSKTPIVEEPVENPFLKNAQGFAPYADSISAVGNTRSQVGAFGPQLAVPVTWRPAETNKDDSEFVYTKLYDTEGNKFLVKMPHHNCSTTPIIDTIRHLYPLLLSLLLLVKLELSPVLPHKPELYQIMEMMKKMNQAMIHWIC